MSSEADRRYATDQALANTRLEGHVPTPAFIEDCAATAEGAMTDEEAHARSLARALAKDRRLSQERDA